MQNKFHYHLANHQSTQQTPGQTLQRLYKAVATFMVHRPQPSTPSPVISSKQRYSHKAKLYPYLPTSEEQRDWLDRLY